MGSLAQILSALVIAILRWLVEREDIKKGERGRLYNEALEKSVLAHEWEEAAAASPGGGADLRVQSDAKPISLQGQDPDSGSGSSVSGVQKG